jgi:hypothetical protein
MMDYRRLMRTLAVPRPNGSEAERATRQALCAWLERLGIPYQAQTFRLYPYHNEALGLWLILSRTLLAIAAGARWGWPVLVIALVGLAGGTLDVLRGWRLVTWPGARPGHNLLLEFPPGAGPATQELIISAHYDSKTEWLDHHKRMFLLRRLPLGMILTLAIGLLGAAEYLLRSSAPEAAYLLWILSALLSLPLLVLAWAMGLYLSLGRLLPPSQGAVDNGAACAVILGLADRLAQGHINVSQTQITLALFTGEEVNLQGSRAYVRSRPWPLPAAALNLEILAQDGNYVYWERDGDVFRLYPTPAALNQQLCAAVEEVTGSRARPAGPLNSDGGSFLAAGIPAAILGTRDRKLGFDGLHSPADNLGRVVLDRLDEGVAILERFITRYDAPVEP